MQVGIIGAGINGLYLAWKLSEKGHKVSVFEKKQEIGNNACSGLFSERIMDFVPQAESIVKNKINHVLIHFPKKTIRIDFSKKFYVMNHADLDRMVFSLSQKAGAEIIFNANVKKILSGFDRVIGADGPNSIVRRSLNLPPLKCRLGILGFVRGTPACRQAGASENFVETWPVGQGLPADRQGFIWKIPRGDSVEYGIMASQKEARKTLEEFLKKNNIILEDVRAKLIPQDFSLPNNKSITLSGDASGLTKPWSGGGVIWQLSLDNILLKNFPDFRGYKKEAYSGFRFRSLSGKLITNLVYFFGFNFPLLIPSGNKMESDFLINK